MSREIFAELSALAKEPDMQQRTLQYLNLHLGGFLRRGERVLICFHAHEEGNLSWLVEQSVLQCGAVPVVWKPEDKWKNLLRMAFLNKASVIVGEPMIVLGLTKLMKNFATPLYIRKVLTAGYPCPKWMMDGIEKGFDCVVGGFFSLGLTGVVAGFACGQSLGVHLWEDVYAVDIVDSNGKEKPEGELGEIVLYPKSAPDLRFPMADRARLKAEECPCGCPAPRIMDFMVGTHEDLEILALNHELLTWTSILDCWVSRGDYGLEIDIVAFRGEKLPKLPTVAKLNLRYFDPDRDAPVIYDPILTNPAFRY